MAIDGPRQGRCVLPLATACWTNVPYPPLIKAEHLSNMGADLRYRNVQALVSLCPLAACLVFPMLVVLRQASFLLCRQGYIPRLHKFSVSLGA